jgi:hypothetical protein
MARNRLEWFISEYEESLDFDVVSITFFSGQQASSTGKRILLLLLPAWQFVTASRFEDAFVRGSPFWVTWPNISLRRCIALQ